MNIRAILLIAASAGLGVTLASCDNGPSAVSTRSRSEASAPTRFETTASAAGREDDNSGRSYSRRSYQRRQADPAADDLGQGLKWAANSRYSAADNAKYQFEHRGAEFGVTDLKAYVSKADAFVAHPPAGVQTMQRSNGDVLMYDPKSNVFAVADKTGAPRTMFKPADGATYWDTQKAKESQRKDRGSGDGEKS
jgi:pyocin large subunit-like protein